MLGQTLTAEGKHTEFCQLEDEVRGHEPNDQLRDAGELRRLSWQRRG